MHLTERTHVAADAVTDDNPGYIRQWHHSTGDYLRAALHHGFVVRACEEPLRPDERPEPLDLTQPPDIWTLHPWIADAANAARADTPALRRAGRILAL